MFRINITISDEVNEKLTAISKRWGVSKSNLCGMVLGQYVDGIDRMYETFDQVATKGIEQIGEAKR